VRTPIAVALAVSLASGCGRVGDLPPDAPPDSDAPISTVVLTASRALDLVAVQDDDGPWTVVAATGNKYTATIRGERYGMLIACSGVARDDGSVELKYVAITDGLQWFHPGCVPPEPGLGTITGTITGAGADEVRISYNFFGQQDLPPMTTNYRMSDIPAGQTKLIAQQIVMNRPVKFVVVDATIAANATTTVNFDFTTGFAPITRTIAMDPNITSLSVTYRDAVNLIRIDRPPSPVSTYRTFPGNQLGPGLTRLTASESQGLDSTQFTVKYLKDPTDLTIPFAAPITLPVRPTATKLPYPSVELTLPKRADATVYDVTLFPTLPADPTQPQPGRSWSAFYTAAWVAKAPSAANDVPFKMPDFTGLAGWKPIFELLPNVGITWSANVTRSTGIVLLGSIPPDQFGFTDGAVTTSAGASGDLPPP
jgi:hypothetical protein